MIIIQEKIINYNLNYKFRLVLGRIFWKKSLVRKNQDNKCFYNIYIISCNSVYNIFIYNILNLLKIVLYIEYVKV